MKKYKVSIKNPIIGVPISIVDKVADDGYIHVNITNSAKTYACDELDHYDNYCAFNVNKVTDIPTQDFIECTLTENEIDTWKQFYGDDLEILEEYEEINK